MELRIEREAEFHNKAYADGLRSPASKYYEVIESSRTLYRDYLEAHCKGAEVLEYGCGQNSLARFLVAVGAAKVTGIDISEVAVRQAEKLATRENCHLATYYVMNAESLEFPDRSFDLICGVAILHHLNLVKALEQIARKLKPDGSAIFKEPLAHNPLFNLYRLLTPKLRTEDEHPLTIADLELAKTYFDSVEVRYFHLFVLFAAPFCRLPIFEPLRKLLDALDRKVFASLSLLRPFAWTAVIVLSKPRCAACSEPTEPSASALPCKQ
jgi:SAM-dependent methyltransferase